MKSKTESVTLNDENDNDSNNGSSSNHHVLSLSLSPSLSPSPSPSLSLSSHFSPIGQSALYAALLHHGASPDVIGAGGNTALHVACQHLDNVCAQVRS